MRDCCPTNSASAADTKNTPCHSRHIWSTLWQTCRCPWLFVSLLFFSLFAQPIKADPLLIATSSSIPPYVITDQHRGIVVEILQQALAPYGHQIEFIYAPNRRVAHMVEEQQVDGVFNLAWGALKRVHYSDPIIDYHNVVITRDTFNKPIITLDDLNGLRVVVFQNAPQFLGEEFTRILERNPSFQEVSNQRSQVLMLFSGRADAIIMERRIFDYFYQDMIARGEIGGGYKVHPLFAPAARYAAFTRETLRDQFNEGLAQLHKEGRIQKIIDSYLPADP